MVNIFTNKLNDQTVSPGMLYQQGCIPYNLCYNENLWCEYQRCMLSWYFCDLALTAHRLSILDV